MPAESKGPNDLLTNEPAEGPIGGDGSGAATMPHSPCLGET
jgi:hypothetical protein